MPYIMDEEHGATGRITEAFAALMICGLLVEQKRKKKWYVDKGTTVDSFYTAYNKWFLAVQDKILEKDRYLVSHSAFRKAIKWYIDGERC